MQESKQPNWNQANIRHAALTQLLFLSESHLQYTHVLTHQYALMNTHLYPKNKNVATDSLVWPQTYYFHRGNKTTRERQVLGSWTLMFFILQLPQHQTSITDPSGQATFGSGLVCILAELLLHLLSTSAHPSLVEESEVKADRCLPFLVASVVAVTINLIGLISAP